MRKLASIQQIVSVSDISFINNETGEEEVAANIVKIGVLGWELVTQRSNNFKVGDFVVYHEIDSLLPASNPAYEFLRKRPTEVEFRLKTIKLKGQISQGLVLPISILFETSTQHPEGLQNHVLHQASNTWVPLEEDYDLTALLGIKKYDPEDPEQAARLGGKNEGQFPSFISKTDETRIQACPFILVKRKGEQMYSTEKIDGSSVTVYCVPANLPGVPKALASESDALVVGLCSRNLTVAEDANNAFWQCINKQNLKDKLLTAGKPLCLQGELFGPGVQKNKLKRKELDINWYNVFDPISSSYLSFNEAQEKLNELDIPSVPIIEKDVPLDFTVQELVTHATRKSHFDPEIWIEGEVWRPMTESSEYKLGRFSFKVINPEFLLKYGC